MWCYTLPLVYPSAPTPTIRAAFGEGEGPIFLDSIACTGSEVSLQLCRHEGVGSHNCGHNEDSGVICTPDGNFDVNVCLILCLPFQCLCTFYNTIIMTSLAWVSQSLANC